MLSKSQNFKSEYCCSIVRIGELFPIEGKDRIVRTMVNGESIVVRKDIVKEGDVLIYASNETQLNKDFLSVNNLFESSSYELNSNHKEVEPYIEEIKKKKGEIKENTKLSLRVRDAVIFLKGHRQPTDEGDIKLYKKYSKLINKCCVNIPDNDVDTLIDFGSKFVDILEMKTNNLQKSIDDDTEIVKANVGFFNKTGRVKMIKFGGIPSMGYLFTIDELVKYNSKISQFNLEENVGCDFDTVDGELFVKAYVPFVPQKREKQKTNKRDKKIKRFDRMILGQFYFHYDTDPFQRCVNQFSPDDKVVISNKLHGTSFICAKVKVRTPIKLPLIKRCWNKFVDFTGLFKRTRIMDSIVEYGNVTSSRGVIKNRYINRDVSGGYYDADLWTEYGELLYPYLLEGMTVYGEICGYVTGSDKMIQKGYDYGCDEGENFMMPYRITTTTSYDGKFEWNVREVYEWTKKLIKEHPELEKKIKPIQIFYEGRLGDLYKDLDVNDHWHENLLERMRNDKERFGMECREPLCKSHKVWREGICIRKNDDEIAECFKLKCLKFLQSESKLMDEIASGDEELSEEMIENYS